PSTLSLHDALPILSIQQDGYEERAGRERDRVSPNRHPIEWRARTLGSDGIRDQEARSDHCRLKENCGPDQRKSTLRRDVQIDCRATILNETPYAKIGGGDDCQHPDGAMVIGPSTHRQGGGKHESGKTDRE